MQQQELQQPSFVYVTESWKPDIDRFRREVEEAQIEGVGDGLTLAEMECSLDLIDADLAALRASKRTDDRTQKSMEQAQSLRSDLEKLIVTMRLYCPR